MKKVEKRLLSWLMVVAMVLSVVHISVPVKAEEHSVSDSKVDIGTPKMDGTDTTDNGIERAKYVFNNTLKIEGTEIRSVSVQFVSVATKGVEEIKYTPEAENVSESTKKLAQDVEISSLTSGNQTHLLLNSKKTNEKGDILPLKAEEWENILKECISIYIESEKSHSIMVSVSEKVNFGHDNLIEYNANNGHYYELVQSKENWDSARENSLKADSMGPLYESYLVNVTSSIENAFVYTICRTTSWIGTTCDPYAKLEGTYDKNTNTITYKGNINDRYGYTFDEGQYRRYNENVIAYWFYVDGPEAGKVMTYGPAQEDYWNHGNNSKNTMKPAINGETIKPDSFHTAAYGAYETDTDKWNNQGDNNWTNPNSYKKSAVYEADLLTDDNSGINEPNNCPYDDKNGRLPYNERYMVIYSREDKANYKWMIPSMWNDFNKINTDYIGSYIIEYSPKPGEVPDVTLDNKQSIVELDGKNNQTITGENFGVRGKSDPLTVNDIVKEENGNVVVTVNGNPSKLDPEVSPEDLKKVNDAIDKNESDVVTVTVKDKTTKQEIPLQITIVPQNVIALKSAETDPYRKDPAHYIAGEKITLENVTLNDGTVYTDEQLKNGNFSYQWQYAENDTDTWHDIPAATGISLSEKNTKKYAGDKVRLVISVAGDLKNAVADPNRKLYVDGDGYSDTDADITGTYIDNYVINASDFIVKLNDAKNMDDAAAITAADASAELNNKTGFKENKPVTDSDVENTLKKVTAPGDVDVTFKSKSDINGKSYTVKDTVTAHVVDNEANKEDSGKKYEIGANDITVSTTIAETFKNANVDSKHAKILAEKAGVVVVSDGVTVKNPVITVKYKAPSLEPEKGVYPVTYVYTYADEKTVEVDGIVTVEKPFFEVTPSNPDPKAEDPKKGIEGPVEDPTSSGNNYVYKIHLDNDVPSVKLKPEIDSADIIGLTNEDGVNITPIPTDGVYTVENVPTEGDVTVKYTVKSNVPGEEDKPPYTYTYIIDRAKSDDATIKDAEPGPGSTEDRKIVEITTDKTEYTWPITLNDPKATVESITKDSGNGNLKYPVNEGDAKDKFTVDNLKPGETTVVDVVTKAENGDKLTYEVRITNNKKSDNVNVNTDTTDPTPKDSSDDPKIEDPVGPKTEAIDNVQEDVKDITIYVPNKVTSLEVIPTREDPGAEFVTDFGNLGLKVYDGTTIDNAKSSVTAYDAKFTVKDLKVNADSKVAVKVKSADGTKTCVYRYTIKREKSNNPEDGVKIDTTADPVPESLEDKPVVDDKKNAEKVGDELVKKITITVPSEQDKVVVHATPKEGKLDKTYGKDGLLIVDKPDDATVTTNIKNDTDPTFTVEKLSTDKDTVVSVKGVSNDEGNIVIYEYTIKRAKGDNVNVITDTTDPTPEDHTDDPKIEDPSAPKNEDIDGDGIEEQVKDIKIKVPNKVVTLEVIPTREDSNASFITTFGESGIKVDAGTIDPSMSYVKDKEAKITVTKLEVGEPSIVSVKVVSADKTKTCVYRYTIEREDEKLTDDGVKINTTADPDPAHPEDKPVVDDDKAPEKVDNELVKKITITVPSAQDSVKVNPVPEEGKIDPKYNGIGLKITAKPAGVGIVNNIGDTTPSFTVNKLPVGKDTVVSVKGVSDDGNNTIIYEYTIKRLSDDNVNVDTKTPDTTPDDPSDDPKVGEASEPKNEDVDGDGNDEQIKDVKITVPNKVTTLEVVPTKEDPSATFDTSFGDSGIKVNDGTSIDKDNSLVTPKEAKFTVTELKAGEPSVVLVKVTSADGSKSCVYRYTIDREPSSDAAIKGVDTEPGANDDEKVVNITTDQPEYTWPIELNDPKATVVSIDKVSGDGNVTYPEGEYPEGKNNFKISDLKPGETTVVKVVTKAENGDSLTYLVNVTNNSVLEPTALGTTSDSVNPADIVYEKTNPQDKIEPIDPNKKIATANALKINGVLVPDDMYSVSPDGKKLIISRDYLATLAKGSYPAVLTYADGTEQNFNVSILDYDETTLVKNPPLFSMYKEIVLKKKNTFTVNLKGITDYAQVTSKITAKGKKAKSVVKIKQQNNGDVLITPKKTGKTQVTCTIIQNGAEYKVVVDIKVLKEYKGTSKNFNLKTKGLVKTSGELPEFNVYKRIVKGKNTKIKFTKVATDAKVKFYVANKKEAKSLKIGKVKRKGKTATCTIVGKKKGWVHLTAEITQNGKTYYTRLLVRIDDGTWSNKQMSKYLK